MCNVLAIHSTAEGCFSRRGIDAPMWPHSSDDLAVFLSGKDDIFLDRSTTSLEFLLSSAAAFSLKRRLALCVCSWFCVWRGVQNDIQWSSLTWRSPAQCEQIGCRSEVDIFKSFLLYARCPSWSQMCALVGPCEQSDRWCLTRNCRARNALSHTTTARCKDYNMSTAERKGQRFYTILWIWCISGFIFTNIERCYIKI